MKEKMKQKEEVILPLFDSAHVRGKEVKFAWKTYNQDGNNCERAHNTTKKNSKSNFFFCRFSSTYSSFTYAYAQVYAFK